MALYSRDETFGAMEKELGLAMDFIQITKDNIDEEHICCAFSDKKCAESYQLKKEWLKNEFDNGFVFRRLDERAKVFIEYIPSESAWIPVIAPNYLVINCFWVSGQYKGKGYAKTLLQTALDDAEKQGRNGVLAVVGTKKFHFMSDGKWLLRQGFEESAKLSSGFSLLVKKLNKNAPNPRFAENVLSGEIVDKEGVVVYYSNKCPFTEYHVRTSLIETVEKRNIPYKIVKLKSFEEAQNCPSPATIFSLFYKGKFVTTDLSVCMDSRFDKIVK